MRKRAFGMHNCRSDSAAPSFLIAQETQPFAVASFYADFHDMSDDEVREILRRAGLRG
jgi:predicted phosphoribosyltransferase